MEYTITVKVEDNGEIQLIGADEYIQNKLSIYFSQSYHANKLIETCKKGIVSNNLNPIVAKLLKDVTVSFFHKLFYSSLYNSYLEITIYTLYNHDN